MKVVSGCMPPCDGLVSRVQLNVGKRTTILQLSFKQLDHSLRVPLVLLIVLDHLAELGNPSVEWAKVDFVVHPRLVHVVQNLLQHTSQISVTTSHYQARTGSGRSNGGSTHPHGCDLGVSRWTFFGLPDGHEEQREQVEHICHCRVYPVVVRLLVISDFI